MKFKNIKRLQFIFSFCFLCRQSAHEQCRINSRGERGNDRVNYWLLDNE